MAMSTTRLIIPYSFTILRIHPRCESQKSLIFNPISHRAISKNKYGSCFLVNQGLQYFSTSNGAQRARQIDSNTGRYRDLAVHSSLLPPGGVPLPSGPPPPDPHSWRSWILGAVVTIILPFLSHKWGPLFKMTKEIGAAVETLDHVAEAIEKVAVEVEKVAEEISDEVPEGGRIRRAVEVVENAAKEIAKDAHLADGILDKVEEAEREVEKFMEPVNDQARGTAD